MTTLTTEETGATQATAAAEKPKAGKNARVAPRRASSKIDRASCLFNHRVEEQGRAVAV